MKSLKNHTQSLVHTLYFLMAVTGLFCGATGIAHADSFVGNSSTTSLVYGAMIVAVTAVFVGSKTRRPMSAPPAPKR